jgi:regulator of sigma E protease
VAVNGIPTPSFATVSRNIRSSHGAAITVTVKRSGKLVRLGPEKTIKSGTRWIWGFEPAAKLEKHSLGASVRTSGSTLWRITTGTGSALAGLFHKKERSQLVGTVGIVRESAAALTVGVPYYLTLVGLVSMSLALLNLLPLLPLDGGHIAVSIIESVRRRALAREVYERVSIIGLAIVLLVAFIALNNDITRPG